MTYDEAEIGDKVIWKDGDGGIRLKGVVKQKLDDHILIYWDSRSPGWYHESLVEMTIVTKVATKVFNKREEYAFFARVNEECCPCGIKRSICEYHK